MTGHIWRAADCGVMLWEPALDDEAFAIQQKLQHWEPASEGSNVLIWKEQQPPQDEDEEQLPQQEHFIREDGIQEYLPSSHDDENDSILPSIEEIFEQAIKVEPVEEHELQLSTPSSPNTLAASSTEPVWTPQSSGPLTLSSSYRGLLTQLNAFTKRATSEPVVASLQFDTPSTSTSPGYDAEGTDFRPASSSPCPPRQCVTDLPEPVRISHHFQSGGAVKNVKSVQRKLDSSMVAVRSGSRTPVLSPSPDEGAKALESLRNIERDQPHQWHEDERQLLTILYRWYDAPQSTTIPRIFNAITGLNIRHYIIKAQFECHLKLYGGRAYPEFGQVMAVPFDDPKGHYDEIHIIIEETARGLHLELVRRQAEVKFTSGSAQWAKSPRTRRAFKSLVRRAAQRERERQRAAQISTLENLSIHVPSLGGASLAARHAHNDEAWSDAEDSPFPSSNATPTQRRTLLPTSHNIAFRVWDDNSRTKFTEEEGFTSQIFSMWRGPLPPPFTPDGEGMQALMVLTNTHLCMSGGASAFVSVSTSLLQVFVKASAMVNPRIAVVVLDHPLLKQPNKTLQVAEIMRMLKSDGQAWWARYKGYAERMVWASIPRAAILSHCSLSDLCLLSTNTQAFLSLDEFKPGRRTLDVSARFKEKNVVLNTRTASSMGFIAKTFGMDCGNASLIHIQDLVSRIVDGWQVGDSQTNDINTTSSIASAFALALGSRIHHIQDVMGAFQDGIQQGLDTVAYYARRCPRLRRT